MSSLVFYPLRPSAFHPPKPPLQAMQNMVSRRSAQNCLTHSIKILFCMFHRTSVWVSIELVSLGSIEGFVSSFVSEFKDVVFQDVVFDNRSFWNPLHIPVLGVKSPPQPNDTRNHQSADAFSMHPLPTEHLPQAMNDNCIPQAIHDNCIPSPLSTSHKQ